MYICMHNQSHHYVGFQKIRSFMKLDGIEQELWHLAARPKKQSKSVKCFTRKCALLLGFAQNSIVQFIKV